MRTLFGMWFSAILSKCSHLLLQYSTYICNLLTYNSSSLPSAPLWSLNVNMWDMEPNLTESNWTGMPLVVPFMYAFYTWMNKELPVVIWTNWGGGHGCIRKWVPDLLLLPCIQSQSGTKIKLHVGWLLLTSHAAVEHYTWSCYICWFAYR